jgi:hypothetical protein
MARARGNFQELLCTQHEIRGECVEKPFHRLDIAALNASSSERVL